jgi:hypothetical protein
MSSPHVFTFSDKMITVPGGGHKAKENAQNIFGLKVLKM